MQYLSQSSPSEGSVFTYEDVTPSGTVNIIPAYFRQDSLQLSEVQTALIAPITGCEATRWVFSTSESNVLSPGISALETQCTSPEGSLALADHGSPIVVWDETKSKDQVPPSQYHPSTPSDVNYITFRHISNIPAVV